MKKLFSVFFVLQIVFISCAGIVKQANQEESFNGMSLDQAIQMAADDIENNVQAGMIIALLNFSSPSDQFSEYVIEELSSRLVQGKKIVVVERKELDIIRQEELFQLSGEVSDESAQSIGKKLGAQLIVSGSLTSIGNTYRFRIKILNVESAAILSSPSADLSSNDQKINLLLTPKEEKIYRIGDIGPSGGIVFYDKGVFSGGWRYLEAAPAETEFTGYIVWGIFTKQGWLDLDTRIGFGKNNTSILVGLHDQLGEIEEGDYRYAALVCANLNFDGYSDWFLPSKDELDLMYKNLKQKDLGGFGNSFYWSSSQNFSNYPWAQYFEDGSQEEELKTSGLKVRAIRAF